MTKFVDTFAFIAWLNSRDRDHERVKAIMNECTDSLLTTEWILVELADAFASPPGRETAARFLTAVREEEQFEIVPYDVEVFDAGFAMYAARTDKSWSLTDCISFAVMGNLGLTEALTADHHFEQAGFHAVFK
jgi:uncharacterized protein